MNFIKKLDNNLFTALIVGIFALIGCAATSFLFTSMIDVPLGFLFSGAVISSLYVISYFFGKIDEKKELAAWSIASISLRLFVIIGVMIILALMNFRWNIKLFNIFVFIGIYTVGAINFVVSYLIKNKGKE